ncbi:putative disease resistance protein At1g50180 [Coffea eugenioides]|uniref:putative disease resistance protein At1g50180 n=1 Tax=Coffea eugenioides TaxID=49369 RepID=UPI000F60D362|nr:putative disease resistance protein At1g50180 [Coffea eugenioides]
MAESIVSTTLETLWGLLKEEAKLLSGVNAKVNELCREFRRMQCFLQDADARQYKDQSVRNSIQEIRSLAYKAENVVETYIIEISSRRGRGCKKSCKRFFCILNELNALHTIGFGIESIRSEIVEVTKSLQAYGIKEIDGGESSSRAANEKDRWLRKTCDDPISP